MSWSRVLSNGTVTRSTLWKSRKIARNVSAVFCVCAASQLYMYSRSEPPPCFTWTAPVPPNSEHHMIMHTVWHMYNYKYTVLSYLTFRVSSAHLQCYWNLNEAIVNCKMLPPQPFHGPFFLDHPGWASARRELLDFMVQGEINRGRHTDHPAGRHSIRTNQCPPYFLRAGCPSCRPTNSVKALKATRVLLNGVTCTVSVPCKMFSAHKKSLKTSQHENDKTQCTQR